MSAQRKTVILGSGGTIAGTAADARDNVGYAAARIGVGQLIEAVPALAGEQLECEQVAQLDSKDMDFATWQRLAQRCAHHLGRGDVGGVVVTHGTDTLEETAYFLHRVLAPADKPLVLTAAMRPATSLAADGPQNLLDAVAVAQERGVHGVVAVLAGTVIGAADLRKLHTYRLTAFDAGDAGPIARIEDGRLRVFRPWPGGTPLGLAPVLRDVAQWPRVEIVVNYAGAGAGVVEALCAQGVQGLVAAGSGNGSLHRELEGALHRAQAHGVRVLRASRCALGPVVGGDEVGLPCAGALSAVQARVELLLGLLGEATAR